MWHHDHEDDYGLAVICNHNRDNHHDLAVKDTNASKLWFMPDHGHDSDHNPAVTQRHGCNLGHDQAMKAFKVERQTHRRHHGRDGPKKVETTYLKTLRRSQCQSHLPNQYISIIGPCA